MQFQGLETPDESRMTETLVTLQESGTILPKQKTHQTLLLTNMW